MPKQSYVLELPKARDTSVIFASPHSSRDYPPYFVDQTLLDVKSIRTSEDAFVDELFMDSPKFGCPFLMAGAPRAFVDLNRSADEFDPAVIEDVRKSGHNPRIASGLGVIPRVVAGGRAIYSGKLPLVEAHRRISDYWRPYHDTLQMLIDQSRNSFGNAILVDCHSMPQEALDHTVVNGRAPDIVLGDRFGASASSEVVDTIEQICTHAGLTVTRNTPFAGAFIAQHYGRPMRGQHVVQIEINRGLYMNEVSLEKTEQFDGFKSVMTDVISGIANFGRTGASLAAE